MKSLKYSIQIILFFVLIIFLTVIIYGDENIDWLRFIEDHNRQLKSEQDLLKRLESRYGELDGQIADHKDLRRSLPATPYKITNKRDVDKRAELGNRAIEIFSQIKGLEITRQLHEYGIYLFSVSAEEVPLADILNQLALSNHTTISFDRIEPLLLEREANVFLEDKSFQDILEILTGMVGLETSFNGDGSIRVTIPSNLGFKDPEEYFHSKIIQSFYKFQINYPASKYVPDSYFRLGDFFSSIGLNVIAIQEFSVVAERYPKHPLAKESIIRIGQSFESSGNLEQARMAYNEFIERYPTDPLLVEVYWLIANNWFKDEALAPGSYEKAITYYKKIIDQYPSNSRANASHERIVQVYMKNKEFSKAFDELIALKRDEKRVGWNAEMDFMVGECLYQMGRYDGAITVFASVLKDKGQQDDILKKIVFRMADCLSKTDRWLEAIQTYRRSLEMFKDDSASVSYGLLAIGRYFRRLELFEQARDFIQEGMERYPDNEFSEDMKFEYAMTLYELKEYDMAIKIFTEILLKADGGMFVDSSFYKAECLFAKKEYKDSLDIYKKLLPLSNDMPERRSYMEKRIGMCYQNMGLFADALDAYRGKVH